ncbi:MAG: hypothetical protein ACE5GJ_01695 [Gemmatimonadota bacterium]
MRRAPGPSGGTEGGFALATVVFLLFAIGVLGAAGYQLVATEFTLADQAQQGEEALVVARAGLERFLGEQIGQVGDSVSYAIGNGVATITTRKVLEKDSRNHLYYVRSEGTVTDIRNPSIPAKRVVGTYAWHRISPVPHKAAILITGGNLEIRSSAEVSGLNYADSLDCSTGGSTGVYAVATGGKVRTRSGGTYCGVPDPEDESYSGFSEVYDTAGIRWDILSDPNFPVEFDGSLPNFGLLPSDSFPLIRYQGNLTAHLWWGRGVLIVTGRFRPGYLFNWDGIILAGELDRVRSWYHPTIHGMLIAGLNKSNPNERIDSGDFYYDSLKAAAADRTLSYLQVVENTVFEAN